MIKRLKAQKDIFRICILLIICFTNLLMLVTFEYCDVDSITAWTLNFWDVLFEFRVDEFYSYTALKPHGAYHENLAGNYLWILPWSIWNFPLWLLHSLTGVVSVTNFWSICWSKLFLFCLEIVMAFFVIKIGKLFTDNKEKLFWACVFMLISPEILMSIGYAGQDEIVYMCFFIAGLYYFLQKKNIKSYILFVLSVSMCPIILLPVMGILLLREKNIFKLLGYLIGIVLPTIGFELLYREDLVYQSIKEGNDFLALLYNLLLGSELGIGRYSVSLVGIVIIFLYFYCYYIREDFPEYNKMVIWLQMLFFVILSFMMKMTFYRLFLYVPLLSLLFLISNQNIKMNCLLITILTYIRTFMACIINSPQTMSTRYVMRDSWITKLIEYLNQGESSDYISIIQYYVPEEIISPVILLLNTCSLGVIIILLIINSPKYKNEHRINISQSISILGYCMCMPLILVFYFRMFL